VARRRNRIRYKPGDIFRIPLPRGRVTFGRILLDLVKISTKTKLFDRIEDCPLNTSLTGGGLLVEIYNRRGRKPADEQLRGAARFPPFVALRDQIYQGEFEIVGHLPVAADELDFPEGTVGIAQHTNRGSTDCTIQYHFQKGGVSVPIDYSEEELREMGGHPGCSRIRTVSVRDAIDGRVDAVEEFVGLCDLRLSPKRRRILKLAGLTPKMTYSEMASPTNGILPEEMIAATERLFEGTTQRCR
jgi:hypothetical protein